MKSVRIDPQGCVEEQDLIAVDVECECGRHFELHSIDGGHPAYCPNCEKAYYLRSHTSHYHVRTESMTRNEILQQNFGHIISQS